MSEEYQYGFHNRFTFTEWMNIKFGDNWPTGDEGFLIWYEYLEYVKTGVINERN